MLFYVVIEDRDHVLFSPAPEVDKLFCKSGKVLHPGLPLGKLVDYLNTGPTQGTSTLLPYKRLRWWVREGWLGKKRENSREEEILRTLMEALRRERGSHHLTDPRQWRWTSWGRVEDTSKRAEGAVPQPFREGIQDRLLTEREFTLLAQQFQVVPSQIVSWLHLLVRQGQGEWQPAVRQKKAGAWVCLRCGSSLIRQWPGFYGEEGTCEACQSLGALSSLQTIFHWKKQPAEERPLFPEAEQARSLDQGDNFPYSPAQLQAVRALEEWDRKALPGATMLIWAACGAGKTEICFPLIRGRMEAGQRVLFAAPRLDVVHDVFPRLVQAFGADQVRLMSGVAGPNWSPVAITVATTHQVLKFRKAFELVILDEMDAFPYAGNEALTYGLQAAKTPQGRLLILSATPSQFWLDQARKGRCGLIRLPARHHGQPLPVPEYRRILLPDNNPRLQAILTECLAEGPVLVFVPRVQWVNIWRKHLESMFPERAVDGSWSADPQRHQKVEALRRGQTELFVSTTILERGVTIPRVQVVVLFADHWLFENRALVQMAGRAGRTKDAPLGKVLFLASSLTQSMNEAISWIQQQNELAQREGLLDEW